jgi:hypothetical protein
MTCSMRANIFNMISLDNDKLEFVDSNDGSKAGIFQVLCDRRPK